MDMRKTLREILQTVLLTLILFAGLQGTIQNVRVEGFSMRPTLDADQYLLVNKLAYSQINLANLSRYIPFVDLGDEGSSYLFDPPQRGEVVVFRFPVDPSRDFVKRVIAVPGDSVEIRNGNVFVNDKALEEPYTLDDPRGITMIEQVMGPDEYFVLGDNRLQSNDSKNWGPVPLENIIGKVWVSYWPLSEIEAF